ncbi:MerR family transcriptional regulator [Sphingomonas sp. Mn802worker]|uniref:MerR family transcriptional regulator n=1 Tax=Sphingomonas sp. Mn802worker TaxID=629773 RepID=UPI00037DA0D3|nr:MerR family transcriptional regulator [Sphingomonas sp. Mn802worker]
MSQNGSDEGSSRERDTASKSDTAFRTIGEVTQLTGVAPHILRYWEGRFPQLKPVTRAGNRRYYRPADVALVQRIDRLLNREGYTVRGVQQLLSGEGKSAATAPSAATATATMPATLDAIRLIRDYLREALDADG